MMAKASPRVEPADWQPLVPWLIVTVLGDFSRHGHYRCAREHFVDLRNVSIPRRR